MSTLTAHNKRIGLLVSRYLLGAILPYFAFAWLLLTVVLFVQQAGRYSDVFFNVNVPADLVWKLTIALLPSVIAFTCPMAILVGTIIGLTKMQGDSELVAIRASGVGNWQITAPIVLIGLLLSGFAFLVNLEGVPLAATLVRTVALQSAIKKLESPVEPGEFNNDVSGYTIYVQKGDVETGRWQNIFIYSEDRANNGIRLVTSRTGRVDTTNDLSELVLENAAVTTIPLTPGQGKYVTENIGDIRLAVKTSRAALIDRLTNTQVSPEELGIAQLGDYAAQADRTPRERIEAELLRERRILLSITPLIFCLLGTAIVLRLNRGGRGFGIALALLVLVFYYLLTFLGEQLARTHVIPVLVAALLPLVGSAAAFTWFSLSRRMTWLAAAFQRIGMSFAEYSARAGKISLGARLLDVTTGIRDFDIVRELIKNFLLTVVFVSVIFLIFTAFEMWKFAGLIDGGTLMLAKYLAYYAPVVYLQIAPSAAMIAILATYIIKSRQNEIVTWTSAGQSVFRLLIPCFLLTAMLGGMDWVLQESLIPRAAQLQDAVRAQIRNAGVPVPNSEITWLANGDSIFSFSVASDNAKHGEPVSDGTIASDNEKQRSANCSACLRVVSVYQFGSEGKLQSVFRAPEARWQDGRLIFAGPVERNEITDGRVVTTTQPNGEVPLDVDPLAAPKESPTHLNTSGLLKQLAAADSGSDQRALEVAIQTKRTTLLLPLVIALFTAPFSLTLSRKGKAATIGYAVGLWLLFTGASNVFEQLGVNGQLSPVLAVWSPLAIFAFLGVYLLTKIRT